MSRKDEDRILHGLFYYRESIDEAFNVSSDQIVWLAAHSYADGSSWYKGQDFQSFDSSLVPAEFRKKLLMSKYELPIRYLQYRRLIKLSGTGIGDEIDVAVTFAGADRAMRLHTRLGRMDVWYQEHREGFLGLVITVAVSLVTALLAVYFTERLSIARAEPRTFRAAPGALYEAEPKAQ